VGGITGGRIPGFEGHSSPKTWVFRILVNTAERRSAQGSRTIPWRGAVRAGDAWPTPKQEAMELPGRPQIVPTPRDVEGHTSEEVWAISTANQRVLPHRVTAGFPGRARTAS
jgi:RNA polymerase sigma-70 factor (ECF subfamily)